MLYIHLYRPHTTLILENKKCVVRLGGFVLLHIVIAFCDDLAGRLYTYVRTFFSCNIELYDTTLNRNADAPQTYTRKDGSPVYHSQNVCPAPHMNTTVIIAQMNIP